MPAVVPDAEFTIDLSHSSTAATHTLRYRREVHFGAREQLNDPDYLIFT
jgi:hypothetical protein